MEKYKMTIVCKVCNKPINDKNFLKVFEYPLNGEKFVTSLHHECRGGFITGNTHRKYVRDTAKEILSLNKPKSLDEFREKVLSLAKETMVNGKVNCGACGIELFDFDTTPVQKREWKCSHRQGCVPPFSEKDYVPVCSECKTAKRGVPSSGSITNIECKTVEEVKNNNLLEENKMVNADSDLRIETPLQSEETIKNSVPAIGVGNEELDNEVNEKFDKIVISNM